MSLTF